MSFAWGTKTFVMGIINVTPDSFSGDGVMDVDAAVEQGVAFAEVGADVLDIGGESSRPGSERITEEEELRRVIPVITRLAKRVKIPLSVDTSRATVAERALDSGASMVNDVWGLTRDPAMRSVVARRKADVVIMHNRAARAIVTPIGGHYPEVEYESKDIIVSVRNGLDALVRHALAEGIERSRIIIDPGIGFGKGITQNLELLRRLDELRAAPGLEGIPLLIGTSRKSVVGLTLNLPVNERLEGTLATLALAIAKGADMVRVHDVLPAVRCCRMADAIVRGYPFPRT